MAPQLIWVDRSSVNIGVCVIALCFATSFCGGAGGGDVVGDHADMRGFDRKTMIRRELPRSSNAGFGLSARRITLSRILLPFPAPPRPPQKLHDLGCPRVSLDPADCPDKLRQLPRYGGGGHGRSLPAHHHAGEFAMEPHFRLPRRLDHFGRLPFASLPDRLPRPMGGVSVMPGGLHQNAPHVAVAALGNGPPPLLSAAGILPRDQPDEIHQLPGRVKAVIVDQLGKDRHRHERLYSPKRFETGDGGGDIGIFRFLLDLCVEPSDPLDLLVDGCDVFGKDRLGILIRKLLRTDPSPVVPGPRFSLEASPPGAARTSAAGGGHGRGPRWRPPGRGPGPEALPGPAWERGSR